MSITNIVFFLCPWNIYNKSLVRKGPAIANKQETNYKSSIEMLYWINGGVHEYQHPKDLDK